MKIKTLVILAMATVATALFSGCTKEEEKTEGGVNTNLTFELEVSNKTASAARILVKHTGSDTDTWYGFMTTDLKTDTEELIVTHIENEFDANNIKKGNNQHISLSKLDAETTYRYIVSGMTADGSIYGTAASVEFTTEKESKKEFTLTEDWSVTYSGRDTYTDENYPDGVDADLITIDNPTESYYYFVYTTEAELEYYYQMELVDYVEYQVELLAYMVANGYATMADMIVNTLSETYWMSRFMSGEYIGVVIGYNADGTPTYTYSVSEFTIEEEEATEEYTRWLGTWDVTTHEEDSTRTYTIDIDAYDNNFMYAVSGWETNGDIYNNIEDYVGEYTFPAYYEKGKLQFVESDLDAFTFEESADAEIYYFGLYGICDYTIDGELNEMTFLFPNSYVMAEAEYDNGSATINGMTYSSDRETIEYTAMLYMAYTESQKLENWNPPMFFPLDMTKVSDGTATSGMKSLAPAKSAKPLVKKAGISNGRPAMKRPGTTPKFEKGFNNYHFGRQATILNK